ncbi:MAG: mannitol dehydrogenase family protein, partial [Bdellovibrionota bacterium]
MTTPILHLGLGRFHRAHQAVYFQRLKDEFSDDRWTITAFSMRSPAASDTIRKAEFRFPVVEASKEGVAVRWIDRIRDSGTIVDDRAKFLAAMCDPALELVTLTITEKGYCLDVAGNLDLNHSDIRADLANPLEPKTAIGSLALGLMKRAERSKSFVMNEAFTGLTVLSCDNLRANGAVLESAVRSYLEAVGWENSFVDVRESVTFPCTMVDRIVPSLSTDARKKFEEATGIQHRELIATEPFSQWVIEDRFARPRPPLDKVGIEFVRDVRSHEEMKLRLLNAAHSFMAY